MKQYLLGIDIGSGGCKVSLLDPDTGKTSTKALEYRTYYPHSGWAEQDSEDWVKSTGALIKQLLDECDVSPSEVNAVGIGGVTHSPVLLDRAGRPVRRTIHLTDARSRSQVNRLRDRAGDLFLEACGNEVDVMWTISMLLWIKETEPANWKRIHRIVFPKDYVRLRLAGSAVTDAVDAQGTLLFNVHENRWDERLLSLISLKKEKLPDTIHPAQVVGRITDEGERWSGLKAGTQVICGTTDTLLELIASGVSTPGDCTVKLATFGRICVLSDRQVADERLITYSYIDRGLWYPGTGTKSFASSLRWFRDQFCRDIRDREDVYRVMEDEAREVKAGSEGLLFHPYLQGEGSPYNDPDLRGDFIGLSLHHERGHLIRAVMEGAAFSLLDSYAYLKERGIEAHEPVKFIGGGTQSKLWLMIVADVLGMDGVKPRATDPSIGAAMLAGVGKKTFGTVREAQECVKGHTETIEHNEQNSALYRGLFHNYKKSVELLGDVYHKLSSFSSK
jgi:xylulokinase